MTADQNAALVRRGYEAFNVGDLATLTELLSEDVTFYQPGGSTVSGDHRGRDEVLAYFGQLFQRSGGTFRVEVEKLYASDRQAVVIHHATGRRIRDLPITLDLQRAVGDRSQRDGERAQPPAAALDDHPRTGSAIQHATREKSAGVQRRND